MSSFLGLADIALLSTLLPAPEVAFRILFHLCCSLRRWRKSSRKNFL